MTSSAVSIAWRASMPTCAPAPEVGNRMPIGDLGGLRPGARGREGRGRSGAVDEGTT